MLADQAANPQPGNDTRTPDWLTQGQLVRTSHLYRFAVLLTGMEEEVDAGRRRRAATFSARARHLWTSRPSRPGSADHG